METFRAHFRTKSFKFLSLLKQIACNLQRYCVAHSTPRRSVVFSEDVTNVSVDRMSRNSLKMKVTHRNGLAINVVSLAVYLVTNKRKYCVYQYPTNNCLLFWFSGKHSSCYQSELVNKVVKLGTLLYLGFVVLKCVTHNTDLYISILLERL